MGPRRRTRRHTQRYYRRQRNQLPSGSIRPLTRSEAKRVAATIDAIADNTRPTHA